MLYKGICSSIVKQGSEKKIKVKKDREVVDATTTNCNCVLVEWINIPSEYISSSRISVASPKLLC